MTKREHISNEYATSHSDKTLEGMMTLKEEFTGQEPVIGWFW
jgi:hypothetical protein